jgi:HlyD family secretion protein
MKRLFALPLLLGLAAGCAGKDGVVSTQPVGRQDVNQTVTATGMLNPQDTVLVGSQVSGTVSQIFVDYNSVVHTGQVLARLDPSLFQASLSQAQGTLQQARSTLSAATASAGAVRMNVASADATVGQTNAALVLAERNKARDDALFVNGYVAQSTIDSDTNALASARAAYRSALAQASGNRANLASATATIRADTHAVQSDEAAVQTATINLRHATIIAPVDGTVIQRNVSVGQTVAAALQAPTLFTIAQDLAKMELDIAVGEPDVGSLHAGDPVEFTVLAYPGVLFKGTVYQVRQNPTIVSNVTTYDTVAYISNGDGRLRSGMTANASIVIRRYPGALVVPLAALQWHPTPAVRERYHLTPPAALRGRSGAPQSQWGQTGTAETASITPGASANIWVERNGKLVPVQVRILAVNGTTIAVAPATPQALRKGDAVVVSAQA